MFWIPSIQTTLQQQEPVINKEINYVGIDEMHIIIKQNYMYKVLLKGFLRGKYLSILKEEVVDWGCHGQAVKHTRLKLCCVWSDQQSVGSSPGLDTCVLRKYYCSVLWIGPKV